MWEIGDMNIDEALADKRRTKVWNEPVYLSPPPHQSDSLTPTNSPLLSSASSSTSLDWDPDSKEPIQVIVEKKGTRFYTDPRRIYPMHSQPRGLALIINNMKFDFPDIYPFRK